MSSKRHFRVGDHVRIARLPSSQWQNRRGTIVEIFEHGPCEEGIVQQCVVDVGGERRWFMDKHLVKTVPVRTVRLFRAEVSERWQLEPNDVGSLNGDREQLVDLLCDRFNFAMRRAQVEVDDFLTVFNERIARAVEPSASR